MIHVTRKGTPRTSDSYHYQKTLESLLQVLFLPLCGEPFLKSAMQLV